jgi:hypothetical protein
MVCLFTVSPTERELFSSFLKPSTLPIREKKMLDGEWKKTPKIT